MVSIKDKLIQDGASPELAETLTKKFYIKEQDSNDTFTQYWVKRIDEKQDKLSDKIDKLTTKEELKNYATQTDIANLRTDIAHSTNKILIVMISVVSVGLTIIGFILHK